jgi:hypothetical protein
MPNWEELAKGMNQPFAPMQQAPGADPNFKPTLDPVLLLNAAKAVGQYFMNQVKQPIQGTMDDARMGHYNVAPGQPVSIDPMNPLAATMMGIGAGWKGGLPAGATGVGMTTKGTSLFDFIRSLQSPGQTRELVSIAKLREVSGLAPAEFDAQILKLAQEGKVALHPHDFASSLKPEQRAKLLAIPNPNAYWGGKDFYVGVVPKE